MTTVPAAEHTAGAAVSRDDLGFLLAKATQRWNELLTARFAAAGYPEVRAAYGSVLVPLYEQDGLRIGQLARRARLSKQTMTTMIRRLERDGLVEIRPDPADALVFLTPRTRRFAPVVASTLAELDAAAREQLGDRAVDVLKRALRQLQELDLG